MGRSNRDPGCSELPLQVEGRGRIAQEQLDRILVVDEMRVAASGISVARRRDRRTVIAAMLDHAGAEFPQAFLLPGLGIVRHVNFHREAERPSHQSDTEAEIAGAADRDDVTAKQVAKFRVREGRIGSALGEKSGLRGQRLGVGQDLVDAPRALMQPVTGNAWSALTSTRPPAPHRMVSDKPAASGISGESIRPDTSCGKRRVSNGAKRCQRATAPSTSVLPSARSGRTDALSATAGLIQIAGQACMTATGMRPTQGLFCISTIPAMRFGSRSLRAGPTCARVVTRPRVSARTAYQSHLPFGMPIRRMVGLAGDPFVLCALVGAGAVAVADILRRSPRRRRRGRLV